jgi:hypothetical protein
MFSSAALLLHAACNRWVVTVKWRWAERARIPDDVQRLQALIDPQSTTSLTERPLCPGHLHHTFTGCRCLHDTLPSSLGCVIGHGQPSALWLYAQTEGV